STDVRWGADPRTPAHQHGPGAGSHGEQIRVSRELGLAPEVVPCRGDVDRGYRRSAADGEELQKLHLGAADGDEEHGPDIPGGEVLRGRNGDVGAAAGVPGEVDRALGVGSDNARGAHTPSSIGRRPAAGAKSRISSPTASRPN